MMLSVAIIKPTRALGTDDAYQRGLNRGAWETWKTLKMMGVDVEMRRKWYDTYDGKRVRELWLYADVTRSFNHKPQ